MSDPATFDRLLRAFVEGDADSLERELGDQQGFPDVVAHPALGWCLVQAIYSSPLRLVRWLLERGADPNLDTHDGFPPLIAAITCADDVPGAPSRDDVAALVDLLLAAGADPDQRGANDETALHAAAARGRLDLVDRLLGAGADPNSTTRIDDPITPLEAAEAAGHRDVAGRLRPLTTSLDWAAATTTGSRADMQRVLDRGHDVDARDGYGQTALMRAAHAGRLDTVEWLVDHQAALDHTATFHLTALMLAVIGGHPAVARHLVRAGAETSVRGTGAPGFAGKTAADLADDRGDRRLADFIRHEGRERQERRHPG